MYVVRTALLAMVLVLVVALPAQAEELPRKCFTTYKAPKLIEHKWEGLVFGGFEHPASRGFTKCLRGR